MSHISIKAILGTRGVWCLAPFYGRPGVAGLPIILFFPSLERFLFNFLHYVDNQFADKSNEMSEKLGSILKKKDIFLFTFSKDPVARFHDATIFS